MSNAEQTLSTIRKQIIQKKLCFVEEVLKYIGVMIKTIAHLI